MPAKDGKYCIQSFEHSKELVRNLCSLIERQFLVDIAISCGNHTVHAHKAVLAANSPYLKAKLEDKSIEQMLIQGMEFSVMKAFIEFMYCGEMVIAEEHMKYFFAGVKLFKIPALENVFREADCRKISAEDITIPPPQFMSKPPKYPLMYKPTMNNGTYMIPSNVQNSSIAANPKAKRRFTPDADKAFHKEAQASRVGLANLRRSMNNQMHSFIVEEAFDEATVESFIPSSASEIKVESETQNIATNSTSSAQTSASNVTPDKFNYILGRDNVEIMMFQANDGGLVNVSNQVVLDDLSKETLQYQVIDASNQMREIHEITHLKNSIDDKTESSNKSVLDDGGMKNAKSEASMPELTSISFDEAANIYSNSIKVHNDDIFETESLHISPTFLNESIEIVDSIDGEDNIQQVTESDGGYFQSSEIGASSPFKKPLIFTPEMFFTDYAEPK